MSWLSRLFRSKSDELKAIEEAQPKVKRQVDAASQIASALYGRTIPGGADAVVDLRFSLPDSRYRYMLFCLSATAAAVSDEIDDPTVRVAIYHVTGGLAELNPAEYFAADCSFSSRCWRAYRPSGDSLTSTPSIHGCHSTKPSFSHLARIDG